MTRAHEGVTIGGEVCDLHVRALPERAHLDGAFRILDPFALVYVWPKGESGPTKEPRAAIVPGYWYSVEGAEAIALAARYA